MGIQGYNQLGGWNARPHTEVELIASHHPSKKQIQAFACAARRGPGEEVADARPSGQSAVRRPQIERQRARRETVERGPDVVRRLVEAVRKEGFDRARPIEHLLHQPDERDDVRFANPAMNHPGEGGSIAARLKRASVGRWAAAHDGQHSLDRLQHARHASKSERRRHESNDFAVIRPREAADYLNGIRRRVGVIEVGVVAVEGRLRVCNPHSSMIMMLSCA